MHIDLLRAHTPKDIGREEGCEVCGERFVLESIHAQICADAMIIGVGGLVCPACLELLGRRNPERFPTLEEYEAAKLRLPRPMFASDEEALAAEETAEDHYQVTVAARRIERAGAR